MRMDDKYILDRSETESDRLNGQHQLFQRNIGYLVHPDITKRLDRSSRVADVGTGTGIFLVDLSKQLPDSCQLDGFDISDAAFPSDSDLPSNVKLHVHDAKTPFSDTLERQYDLVHLKLMVTGLDKDDWATVLSNVTRLLKPGGSIQWTEADYLGSSFHWQDNGDASGRDGNQDRPSSPPQALKQVGDKFKDAAHTRLRYGYSTLKDLAVQQGLQQVSQDVIPSDRVPETREALTRLGFAGIFGWQHHQSQADTDPEKRDESEVNQLERKCDDEISKGAYYRFDIHVFTAVKSS